MKTLNHLKEKRLILTVENVVDGLGLEGKPITSHIKDSEDDLRQSIPMTKAHLSI